MAFISNLTTWFKESLASSGTRPVDKPPTQREIDAAKWFKATFENQIRTATQGLPITTNLLTAIAMQETYYIWVKIYQILPVDQVLLHCTGDSIGEPDRTVRPKTIDDLKSWPHGEMMFGIARECLARTGNYIKSYAEKYAADPKIFCHGYGIFQYDIQFFNEDPDFFLQQKWVHFDECLNLVTRELIRALGSLSFRNKAKLSHAECIYLAIAYNQGSARLNGSFRQGHWNKYERTYYGEYIDRYLGMIEKFT
ncbi:MAG: hypothetical protein ABL907_10300 [Hyphomicrobium sp.]